MNLRGAPFALATFLLVICARGQSQVSFGVLGLFHPHELELRPADAQVLTVSSDVQIFALNGEPAHRRLILRAAGNRILIGGLIAPRITVSARDGSQGRFQLSVPGRMHRIYVGNLTVTADRGELIAVVAMDRENAVASIVASEMPRTAPLEALKAQAVVTRSFLVAGPRHRDFEFCDTTHCQFLRSPDDVDYRIREAVETTRGLVLTWNQRPIAAMYSSRCGGQTTTMREAGMEPGDDYPYYSVDCPWCRQHPVNWQTRLMPNSQRPQSTNESSRIKFAREWGWKTLPGNHFTITDNAEGQQVEGQNIGHGLGLCQLGAIGMAAAGGDFRLILAHYYPNSTLRVLP